MPLLKPSKIANAASQPWQSVIFAAVGDARVKVLRMDGTSTPEEVHDYNELLIVLEGLLALEISGERVEVHAGEVYLATAGERHSVLAGSRGTLLIVDK